MLCLVREERDYAPKSLQVLLIRTSRSRGSRCERLDWDGAWSRRLEHKSRQGQFSNLEFSSQDTNLTLRENLRIWYKLVLKIMQTSSWKHGNSDTQDKWGLNGRISMSDGIKKLKKWHAGGDRYTMHEKPGMWYVPQEIPQETRSVLVRERGTSLIQKKFTSDPPLETELMMGEKIAKLDSLRAMRVIGSLLRPGGDT